MLEQNIYQILGAKFDNVWSNFFVSHLGQKFVRSQTGLGLRDSSQDIQNVWISPWLGWKTTYAETLYSKYLSAKFDNVKSTFSNNA